MKESTESRIVRVLCNGKADFLIFCEKVNRIPNLKYILPMDSSYTLFLKESVNLSSG